MSQLEAGIALRNIDPIFLFPMTGEPNLVHVPSKARLP